MRRTCIFRENGQLIALLLCASYSCCLHGEDAETSSRATRALFGLICVLIIMSGHNFPPESFIASASGFTPPRATLAQRGRNREADAMNTVPTAVFFPIATI